jgi:hypothetical protein
MKPELFHLEGLAMSNRNYGEGDCEPVAQNRENSTISPETAFSFLGLAASDLNYGSLDDLGYTKK